MVSSVKKVDYISSEIEKRLLGNVWKVGDRLPIDTELAAEFNCSVGTISKAIDRFARNGLLERRTRTGTRVIRKSAPKSASLDLEAYAFIYPSDKHEGIRRIVAGFQNAAFEEARRTLVIPTGVDSRKEAEMLGRLSEFDVKGAVIFPVLLNPEDQVYYMQMILACPFPVVLVGVNLTGIRRPSVVVDGIDAGYTMTKHLVAQGARRIGYLGNYSWVNSGRDRYLGYRQAMSEAGLPVIDHDVCLDSTQHPNYEQPLKEPTEIAKRYLEKQPGLEAVMCSNDFMAGGCLLAARELGLSVPAQLKVTGIDGLELLPTDLPKLTSYHTPFEGMGKEAFASLVAAEQGKTGGLEEKFIRGEIVIGEST